MILLGVIKMGIITLIVISILLFCLLIIFPPKSPPVMSSIDAVCRNLDYSNLPLLNYVTARDGTQLAYRFYAGTSNKVAILIHGSSASSLSMHTLGKALSKGGVVTFAVDVRGHGDSGNPGDINYVGQLEDDLADVVKFIRIEYPNAEIRLIGHSSGGGFALRVASSPQSHLFSQYILLAPYLNYDSPTVRPDSGGWASASIPRMIGLPILNRLGIHYFDNLGVVAFAVPKDLVFLTKVYSYRLWSNYKAHDNNIEDFRKSSKPVNIIVGEEDEILYADQFIPTIGSVSDKVTIEIVPHVNHMAIISNENALKIVAQHF